MKHFEDIAQMASIASDGQDVTIVVKEKKEGRGHDDTLDQIDVVPSCLERVVNGSHSLALA